MIRGIIFDYGGTLDTRGDHWGKVIWHAYEHSQVPVSENQYRDAYVYGERTLGRNPIVQPSYTFKQTLDIKLRLQLEYLVTHAFLHPADKKEFQNIHTSLHKYLYQQVCDTVADSREVLKDLYEHYPLVLVSNFYGNVNMVLTEMKVDRLFLDVVESAVVGVRKPDPRIWQMGVEVLQRTYPDITAQEILVVGDSMGKDIIPAKSVGCRTAWYKGEGWTDQEEDQSAADYVITCLEDLLTILQ